jgi:hypothetical protein
MATYSKDAVNAAIASSNRSGRRIGGKEARMIHALLAPRRIEIDGFTVELNGTSSVTIRDSYGEPCGSIELVAGQYRLYGPRGQHIGNYDTGNRQALRAFTIWYKQGA